MTTEKWLPVVGYEGLYEVSDLGRVRGVDRTVRRGSHLMRVRARMIAADRGSKGYLQVSLRREGGSKTCKVHALVAAAFLGERPIGMHICHADGRRDNPALSNLRYDTPSANAQDSINHGTFRNLSNSYCRYDHELIGYNLIFGPDGDRQCRACRGARHNARRRCRRSSALVIPHQVESDRIYAGYLARCA